MEIAHDTTQPRDTKETYTAPPVRVHASLGKTTEIHDFSYKNKHTFICSRHAYNETWHLNEDI